MFTNLLNNKQKKGKAIPSALVSSLHGSEASELAATLPASCRFRAYLSKVTSGTDEQVKSALQFIHQFNDPSEVIKFTTVLTKSVTSFGLLTGEYTADNLQVAMTLGSEVLQNSFSAASATVYPILETELLKFVFAHRSKATITSKSITTPSGVYNYQGKSRLYDDKALETVLSAKLSKEPKPLILDPESTSARFYFTCRCLLGKFPRTAADLVIPPSVVTTIDSFSPDFVADASAIKQAASMVLKKAVDHFNTAKCGAAEALYHVIHKLCDNEDDLKALNTLLNDCVTLPFFNHFDTDVEEGKYPEATEKGYASSRLTTYRLSLALQRNICSEGDNMDNPTKVAACPGLAHVSNQVLLEKEYQDRIPHGSSVAIYGMSQSNATGLLPGRDVTARDCPNNIIPFATLKQDQDYIVFHYCKLLSNSGDVLNKIRQKSTEKGFDKTTFFVIDEVEADAHVVNAAEYGTHVQVGKRHTVHLCIKVSKVTPDAATKNIKKIIHMCVVATACNVIRLRSVFCGMLLPMPKFANQPHLAWPKRVVGGIEEHVDVFDKFETSCVVSERLNGPAPVSSVAESNNLIEKAVNMKKQSNVRSSSNSAKSRKRHAEEVEDYDTADQTPDVVAAVPKRTKPQAEELESSDDEAEVPEGRGLALAPSKEEEAVAPPKPNPHPEELITRKKAGPSSGSGPRRTVTIKK